MMGWDPAYTERVLEPDYGFAGRYLFHHFIDALIAHADTVQRLSLCAARAPDCARLRAALVRLREEPVPPYEAEIPDLCSAIHRRLERDLGEAVAGLLRIGLSRNDLDMTVYKMRAREVLLQIGLSACALRDVILGQAERHTETVLVAHTHHRPGQPTTVAHYLSAIENALSRDVQRQRQVYARLNTCPLGSAALAGSSYGLDRWVTAGLLGFDAPVSNTYDAVASSDWQVDIVTAAQSCALNLSRVVCDLLGWSSAGVFVLPEGLVQGSSIMPQKRNPVALEHARTRFSRALGAAQMVLYSSHNIPYADLNDFGPDIQGALQTLFLQFSGGIELLTACLAGGRFDTAVLEHDARTTDTTATELADELVKRYQFSFPAAHALVAALVLVALGAFRAHPARRAEHPAGAGENGGVDGSGDAEVHDFRPVGGEDDIGGFEVAVHDFGGVNRRNGLGKPCGESA
jgi:argininosuccinate lyase